MCASSLNVLQSSNPVSANAHFYVQIDYPEYMQHLALVSAPSSATAAPSPPQTSRPLQRRPDPPAHVTLGEQPPAVGLKRVISFSVYGTKLRYLVGAIKNAILAQRYFPQFEVWFYVGE